MPPMASGARTYGGRSAAERAAERRGRLVAAAITALGTQGESATTMTGICQGAGLTERYFYESFKGRDDALVAALDAVAGEVAAAAVAAIEGHAAAGGSAGEAVGAALAAVVDLVSSDPAKGRVLVVESAANAPLRARRHALVGEFADLVARQATALYGDRAWPPARARVHGTVFVAGLSELVAAWLAGEVDLDRDELVATGRDLFEAVLRRS